MENKSINKLLSICLLDGRNRDKLEVLRNYFSEFALIKFRILVETEYLIFLSENTNLIPKLNKSETVKIKKIYEGFTPVKAVAVKELEKKTNHDVKAVEYYLRDQLIKSKLNHLISFVHFGLTSYDINIPAYGLILSEFKKNVLLPYLYNLQKDLKEIILKTKKSVMLARTHGQPALPTTFGKEMAVFYNRLKKESQYLLKINIEGKLTGAVGNFNALRFVAPQYDWLQLSKKFITQLGLVPNLVTTQILPYDNWISLFDAVRRINSVLINLCQDIWWYISLDYITQKKIDREVGSSTMAQKINPITFENAEGNLQLSNSLFEFFARKLPVSRLQRDLSDSTVKRDFGLAFGFTLLAYDSILAGFKRIEPDNIKMKQDLDDHWEIFAEGIQSYLRLVGNSQAFEIIQKVTRGRKLTKKEIYSLIDKLPIANSDKQKLKINSLASYLGLTDEIIKLALKNDE